MCERSLRGSTHVVLLALAAVFALAACGKGEKPPTPPASAPAPPAQLPSQPAWTAPPAPVPAPVEPQKPAATAPAPAATGIGRIDALEGDVRIRRSSGELRAQQGMTLEEGDTVSAAADAWALLAMSDGASVTLRANTELRFDVYRYDPDGAAKGNSALLSLAKGALRSITGYIGKNNRAGYQVKTATATIGIRGTDHEPAHYPPPAPGETPEHPPGTYDKVNSGESVIRTPAGTVPVKRGQTAFARFDTKVRPQILARPPAFYQRQAEVDKRAAVRRAEFHREFDQQRQKRLQEQQQQQREALRKAQDDRKAKQQQDRAALLQSQKLKQDERKAEQEKQRADRQLKQQQQKEKGGAARDDKKGAAAKDDRKAPAAKDDRKAKAKDERKKDEQKAALPPSVADRVRNMQRGDKGSAPSTPAERREARSDTAAQARQQQQQQTQQRQQQQQQPQSQSQTQQQQRQQQQREQRQQTQQQREQTQAQQRSQQSEQRPQRAQPAQAQQPPQRPNDQKKAKAAETPR